jgi:hypothetical protein
MIAAVARTWQQVADHAISDVVLIVVILVMGIVLAAFVSG